MTEDNKGYTPTAFLAVTQPIGSAFLSFEDPLNAMLAVFVFGLAMGALSSEIGAGLANAGDAILRDGGVVEAEYDRFLAETEKDIEDVLG